MEPISANRLETHVYKLAGEIGEHNIYHPRALNAVASYICQEWRQQGYEVIHHSYTVEGMELSLIHI